MTSCLVCCETLNKSTRKQVVCNYCDYVVCRECTAKYILDKDNTQDPHCMNCKNAWNREIIENNFTKRFYMTDYKKYREDVIYDRERSLLPETQPYVEQTKFRYDCNKTISKLTSGRIAKNKELGKIKYLSIMNMSKDERIIHFTKIGELEKDIAKLNIDIQVMIKIRDYTGIENRRTEIVERREFVRACPANDCKGFLSTQWKCGLCDCKVCNKCHEIKKEDEEHTCDPNNVATAELLSKDTKSCPKCAVMITKIVGGCDQMWCSACHTAFSWNTLRIDTGTIHNPHFYEFQRRMNNGNIPRVPGDNPCGQMPYYYTIQSHISQYFSPNIKEELAIITKIMVIHRMYAHIDRTILENYPIADRLNGNRDLRIKYMLNDLTTVQFKHELQKREKDSDKKREIRLVFDTYQTLTRDMMNEMLNTVSKEEIIAKLKSMDNIREYINECMTKISNRYNNVAPLIIKDWSISSTGIEKQKEKEAQKAK